MRCITLKPGQLMPQRLLDMKPHDVLIYTKCVRCNYEYEHQAKFTLFEVTKALPKCPRTVKFAYPCDHNGCRSMLGKITEQVVEVDE